jgi:hypothetical protein
MTFSISGQDSGKLEDDMANTGGTEIFTVYNKPPFINEILSVIKPETLSVRDFNRLIEESSIYDVNAMLTAMTREMDVSGLVPNLVGTCNDPQETLKVLTDISHKQLMSINEMEPEIQQEVRETLTGRDFSMRAIVILDEIQKNVIADLTAIRQKSPLALAVRQASDDALRQLYKSPIKIRSEIFDKAIRMEERDVLEHGVPRISYPRHVVDGDVVEVWQYYQIPHVQKVRLTGHFGKLTVGQVLESITPEFYIRDSRYDDRYDPESPVGFLGLLGKVGNALVRLIITQVKRNSRIKEMVLQEDAMARALYELFTRYPKAD